MTNSPSFFRHAANAVLPLKSDARSAMPKREDMSGLSSWVNDVLTTASLKTMGWLQFTNFSREEIQDILDTKEIKDFQLANTRSAWNTFLTALTATPAGWVLQWYQTARHMWNSDHNTIPNWNKWMTPILTGTGLYGVMGAGQVLQDIPEFLGGIKKTTALLKAKRKAKKEKLKPAMEAFRESPKHATRNTVRGAAKVFNPMTYLRGAKNFVKGAASRTKKFFTESEPIFGGGADPVPQGAT